MLYLEKAKIYGVDGVGGSSPTLTRTDDAVGKTYTRGNTEIVSDFNNCYPWSEMQEVVDASGNVFIKIPKFYCKITKNENGTYKHQISGVRYGGFSTLFIDGKGNEIDYILVGKYEGSYDSASGKMRSVTGATVKVSINITQYRNYCKANGDGYQQYDFLIDLIIKELFMVEFATTHTQSIMTGYTNGNNTAALITGHTDAVRTPSGSWNNNHEDDGIACETCNTDGEHACKYRGIENPFGNVWKFVDGISFDDEKIYVCTDPTAYESTKYTAPYFYMGNRPQKEGYAKVVAPFEKNPLLQFTSEVGAGATTYYADYYYYNAAGTVLLVGGRWYYGANAGLWLWSGFNTASNANASVGGRLCYKPL